MATVSTTVKQSPDARSKVREVLEPDTNNWLTAATDVIGEAIRGLRKKGLCGLCVIVDDLDKMITRLHASAGCSTTEYLFVHRSSQLTAFHCHLIYTLPIDLAYSHHEPTIKRLDSGEAGRSAQIARTMDNEAAFRELLDSRALLLYRNDEEWYSINPAIAGLKPPLSPPESGNSAHDRDQGHGPAGGRSGRSAADARGLSG